MYLKKYSQMVAQEGGFELNGSSEVRNMIASVLDIMRRIGAADAYYGIISQDALVDLFTNYIIDNVSLVPVQVEKLKQNAEQWTLIAYQDGVKSKTL